ncbi:MAG: ribosome hibernation-promoting factor, HPF/YfiA family [Sporichthyaceae bacterium]
MEIVVKGRHTEVADRFRQHATEKLSKLEKWDNKLISLDVEVSRERNPRLAEVSDRIELTCRSRGTVIRAEAAAGDPYAALDLATTKLEVRLRKSADRRRVHHGVRTPVSVAAATAGLEAQNGHAAIAEPAELDQYAPSEEDTGPFVVSRDKSHQAIPMTLDQALYEMELVGHDFYLFVEAESATPCVVYRRRGYDYGVIRLVT